MLTVFLALCMCTFWRGNVGLLLLVKYRSNSQVESLQSVRRWTECSWARTPLAERQSSANQSERCSLCTWSWEGDKSLGGHLGWYQKTNSWKVSQNLLHFFSFRPILAHCLLICMGMIKNWVSFAILSVLCLFSNNKNLVLQNFIEEGALRLQLHVKFNA